MNFKPSVYWLTGLSGAGKTTIASGLVEYFRSQSVNPIWLDGDDMRLLYKTSGFDKTSRQSHNLQVGKLASFFEKQGHIVIVSMISPYADTREEIRLICGNYVEIYISTPLKICIRRDPKGLYNKALNGDISEFTGVSSPYEAPEVPEIVLNTEISTIQECVNKIINTIEQSYVQNF